MLLWIFAKTPKLGFLANNYRELVVGKSGNGEKRPYPCVPTHGKCVFGRIRGGRASVWERSGDAPGRPPKSPPPGGSPPRGKSGKPDAKITQKSSFFGEFITIYFGSLFGGRSPPPTEKWRFFTFFAKLQKICKNGGRPALFALHAHLGLALKLKTVGFSVGSFCFRL